MYAENNGSMSESHADHTTLRLEKDTVSGECVSVGSRPQSPQAESGNLRLLSFESDGNSKGLPLYKIEGVNADNSHEVPAHRSSEGDLKGNKNGCSNSEKSETSLLDIFNPELTTINQKQSSEFIEEKSESGSKKDEEACKSVENKSKAYDASNNSERESSLDGQDGETERFNLLSRRATYSKSSTDPRASNPSMTNIISGLERFNPTYSSIYHRSNGSKEIQVWEVTLEDKRKYVLKATKVSKHSTAFINSLINEYRIGKVLGLLSPYVARAWDLQQRELEDEKVVTEVLMDYGGVSLASGTWKLRRVTVLRLIYQLLNLFEFMEKIGVAHFDIKPQNIVWNHVEKRVKLIDFGTSLAFYDNPGSICESMDKNHRKITGFTRYYAPPELIKRKYKKVIPQKVDVYCFGVTVLELILMKCKGYNAKNSKFSVFRSVHQGNA